MSAAVRNAVVWAGVALVLAAVWYFGARTRLHFIDPSGFLLLIVAAAAALAGLLWWDLATGDAGDDPPADAADAKPNETGEGS
jgi:hypothetical protein